ncbi:MAG: methionyl-tRNA formyltransferase, partial [Oscillospiraceae bacterium]
GKLLPKAVLDAPKKACINVHASLLPKYRGAGPIQWSVLNGETETGVTTMLMAEGLDTGDMLLTAKTEIGINETSSELHDRLSEIGAKTLIETIKAFEKGQIKPIAQKDLDSTYAPMITKDLCKIDFAKSANEIHNQIRGLSSSPCAKANLGGKIIKIYKSELVEGEFPNATFGEIIDEINFIVACGDKKAIKIIELQTEGGKRLKAADFLRGNKIEIGTILY